jgi:hypothetical protein
VFQFLSWVAGRKVAFAFEREMGVKDSLKISRIGVFFACYSLGFTNEARDSTIACVAGR